MKNKLLKMAIAAAIGSMLSGSLQAGSSLNSPYTLTGGLDIPVPAERLRATLPPVATGDDATAPLPPPPPTTPIVAMGHPAAGHQRCGGGRS